MTARYAYAAGDLLARPHTYFYSAFGGPAFLEAWRTQRLAAAAWFDATAVAFETGTTSTDRACALFTDTMTSLDRSDRTEGLRVVALLVQRFEVTKRVYGAYDDTLRPVDRDDFRELPRYVAFGQLLERSYRASQRLPCLNALLKLNDILGAYRDAVPPGWRCLAAQLQRDELHHVDTLAATVEAA